jgi:purine-binding chemotaxis protein CheW
MNRNGAISSEQALKDYFTSLLDEEAEELELAQENTPPAPEEPYLVVQSAEVVPQLQRKPEPQYLPNEVELPADMVATVDVPNLDDIQRLLSQLEASNPVDEYGVEDILEQNTRQLAAYVQSSKVAIKEEIQEWEIEETELEEAELVSIDLDANSITTDLDVVPEIEAVADNEVVVSEPELDYADAELVRASVKTAADAFHLREWESPERNVDFQVLYFDVNGVTFAVPLDELGGIHRLGNLSHLIGRPKWYLGLQTNRDNQLDVVDTAKWVMPEKLTDIAYKDLYQYVVMLGDSHWGLASTELKGTEVLNYEKVRWREKAGKRPWLAGMVKEKMCALIHVEALIAMLKAGLDVKALDK